MTQSVGMDHVDPFTFNCVRCLMDDIVLLSCIWFSDRKNEKRKQVPAIPGARKTLVMGGIYCGMALYLASDFQQLGTQYTAVKKAGFTAACHIVIVPVLGLLLGKKCSPVAAGAMVLFPAGLYMLYMSGGELSVDKGDLLILVRAFLFAVYIMVTDFFSPVMDSMKISCTQFFVGEILPEGAMLVNETPGMSQIMTARVPVLYTGIVSYGMAYALQIMGQKGMNPTVASLILSLRPSTSVLAGRVILGQGFSSRGVLDCVLMFDVIILAQIPVG